MRKFLFLIILTLSTLVSSQASAFDWPCSFDNLTCNWDAEVRVAAYRPSSKLFRHIYGNWGTEYQFEAAKQLGDCSNFYGWGSVGYFTKHGHSIVRPQHNFYQRHTTRISMVPVNFGVKYLSCLTTGLDYYLGVGASSRLVKISDHNRHLHRHTTKAAWGVVLKSGVRYALWECTYADLFADYSYNKLCLHKHRQSANVGGLALGGGLGMKF